MSAFLRHLPAGKRADSGDLFQREEKMKRSLFSSRVIKIVSVIRRGETMTYKEVARRAGNSGAARAVGNILNKYYKNCTGSGRKTIPCHRVIRSDGGIGGYVRGEKAKRRLLEKEKAI
jgi:methylated-DNA-[protein]-cysteine S-methyltransferase